jgi:hypothetical protein
VRAASRGVPDRRAIPGGPDWKVRAASRGRAAEDGDEPGDDDDDDRKKKKKHKHRK